MLPNDYFKQLYEGSIPENARATFCYRVATPAATTAPAGGVS